MNPLAADHACGFARIWDGRCGGRRRKGDAGCVISAARQTTVGAMWTAASERHTIESAAKGQEKTIWLASSWQAGVKESHPQP